MGLIKLGKYITTLDLRNSDNIYDEESVVGLSTQKMMINTKADLAGVSLTSYKLMPPGSFAYVPDTSRRGDKMSLAFNSTGNTYLVSSISIVFSICKPDELNSDYLFMYFNRPEFDRYARFNSWGSAREAFSWEDMCDIDIELPPLPIQQKYVDVYNAMLENQRAYETGLEDLKLVCDSYIEDLRRKTTCEPIGKYIVPVSTSNGDNKVKCVQGVESSGSFMDTRAKMQGIDISKYTVVSKGDIAYNPSRINLGSISLYRDDKPCIVSPMYQVFRVNDTGKVLPEYLMLWYGREEFQRYTWFYASGSVRDTFDFGLMKEVEFPIPDINIQEAIVEIYNAYLMRRDINEKLKSQIKNLCPILIKGSLKEANS